MPRLRAHHFSPDMTPLHIGEFTLRRAERRDADAAYQVCLATGDGGRGAEHLYADPKALGHIYVGPYLKLEPELALVLEDAEGVCGYALGAINSQRFHAAYLEAWLPELRRRHPDPGGDPSRWSATERVYHEYHHPEIFRPEPAAEYPSHLHIDLLARAQGRGLGVEMMQVMLRALREQGSPGVHLGMNAGNARALKFYQRLGFRELHRTADVFYLGLRLEGGGNGQDYNPVIHPKL